MDFNGKVVRIVTTHEGSGLANVPKDIKRICVGANVLDDAIAIKGTDCKNAKSKIENWIWETYLPNFEVEDTHVFKQ